MTSSIVTAKNLCHRRRDEIENKSTPANATPPTGGHAEPARLGTTTAAEEAAVVVMVSVADPEAVPVIVTGLVEPKLNVGAYWAFAGLEVIAALNATAPVNPPEGLTAMTDVLPVVAPFDRFTAVPLMAKFGPITVTVAEPLALA